MTSTCKVIAIILEACIFNELFDPMTVACMLSVCRWRRAVSTGFLDKAFDLFHSLIEKKERKKEIATTLE
jgi:hypothetical protein